MAFEAALAEAAPGTWAPRPADDIYMLYTGGTTGMPKGVMYENGAFCAAMAAAGLAIRGLEPPESLEDLVAKGPGVARRWRGAGELSRPAPRCTARACGLAPSSPCSAGAA